MKRNDKSYIKIIALLMLCILALGALASCAKSGAGSGSGSAATVSPDDPFYDKDPSVVIGYDGMDGYDGDIMLRDTTVLEVKELMDAKKTFVLFMSFEDCPWCNLLISHLNDAARDAGVLVGYIDTRANPEWQNNMDIDDYDVFTDLFGKWLTTDEDGKPHLYVPDVYFIKKGKVVARHDGVTPGADDPSQGLTDEQLEQLQKDLASEFAKLR